MAAKKNEKTDDTKVFVPEATQDLIDNDDNPVVVPRPSWKAEITVVRKLGSLIGRIWASGAYRDGKFDLAKVQELVLEVVETGPDNITESVAAILGKPKEYVEAKLTSEQVVLVLLPFLQSRVGALMKVLAPFLPIDVNEVVTAAKAEVAAAA